MRDLQGGRTPAVDGVDSIRLVSAAADAHPQGSVRYAVIWVSSGSYLPVRVRAYTARGSRSWYQIDYRWLAPTRANLALPRVAVPRGFRLVSPPGPGKLVIGQVSN